MELLPLMIMSRIKNQYFPSKDVMDELRMSAEVKSVMDKFMNIELGIINAGVNMPCGGSLLIVAQRI